MEGQKRNSQACSAPWMDSILYDCQANIALHTAVANRLLVIKSGNQIFLLIVELWLDNIACLDVISMQKNSF